jgi:hypothetical protein
LIHMQCTQLFRVDHQVDRLRYYDNLGISLYIYPRRFGFLVVCAGVLLTTLVCQTLPL